VPRGVAPQPSVYRQNPHSFASGLIGGIGPLLAWFATIAGTSAAGQRPSTRMRSEKPSGIARCNGLRIAG